MFLLFVISFNSFSDKFIILVLSEKSKNKFYDNLGICRVIIYFTVGLN